MGLPAIFFIYLRIISYLWLEAPASTFPILLGAWGLLWGGQGEGAGGCSVPRCCADTGEPPSYGVTPA